MSAEPDAIAHEGRILSQAAEWFAVLGDENTGDDERRRWHDWLAADPAHARAWQRVEAISQPFLRAAGAGPAGAAHETLARAQQTGRRRTLRLLGFGGMAAGCGLLLRHTLPWQVWLHDYAVAHAAQRTAIGERRELRLEDGTRLALNTASAVDLDFGHRFRRIVLHRGEILVDSAPDRRSPARPLVVDTPSGRLTALGTRFAVRGDAAGSLVAVFQGTVRIAPAGGGSIDLVAGRQARFTAAGVQADSHADPARESWLRGQLIADDMPLADFIAELARYTFVPIALDPRAARHRLVGVYSIADPGQDVPAILAALEQALPVRVQRTRAGGLFISSR